MANYQRKSFDFRGNTFLPEDDYHHKNLGVTSPFTKPTFENKIPSHTNEKKYSYQHEPEDSGFSRPRTPSAGVFNKTKDLSLLYEGDFGSKFKRSKNYVGGICNQTFMEGDDLQKGKTKKGNRYDYRDQSSYLLEEKEDEKSRFQQRSGGAYRYENNKENYLNQVQYQPQSQEESICESFQKINEEEILKKIGRINKLNQEINGRLQKILVKVTSND